MKRKRAGGAQARRLIARRTDTETETDAWTVAGLPDCRFACLPEVLTRHQLTLMQESRWDLPHKSAAVVGARSRQTGSRAVRQTGISPGNGFRHGFSGRCRVCREKRLNDRRTVLGDLAGWTV